MLIKIYRNMAWLSRVGDISDWLALRRVLGDDAFRRFRDATFPALLAVQRADGSIPCICRKRAFGVTCDTETAFDLPVFREGQEAYTTALSALVLLLDGRSLRSLDALPAPAASTPSSRGR